MITLIRPSFAKLTVGGDKFIVDPRRSCGPILECRLIGKPPPGVPPGELAHDGATRILGVINVLSESRRFGNALTTLKKLLSGDEGDAPNHHPPKIPTKHKNYSNIQDEAKYPYRYLVSIPKVLRVCLRVVYLLPSFFLPYLPQMMFFFVRFSNLGC